MKSDSTYLTLPSTCKLEIARYSPSPMCRTEARVGADGFLSQELSELTAIWHIPLASSTLVRQGPS